MEDRTRSGTAGSKKTIDLASTIYRRRGVLGVYDSSIEFIAKAYNPETSELWGRTGLSWLLILAFYFCFYTTLISFFVSLGFFWSEIIIDMNSPKYSGPDEGLAWTPGVSHVPVLDPDRRSTLLRFSRSNDSQIEQIKDFMYDSFLQYYEPENWVSEDGHIIDCTEGRTSDDPEKVCEFKLDAIRPCVYEDDYGWADGQPCIMLKLNKINNWIPENYHNESEVPDEIKGVWKKDIITVKCFGSDPVSREHIGEIEYFPYQGWSYDYYPFTGQLGYRPPLVAVQFTELPHRMAVFITCKAYSRNMIYDESRGLGMTRFEIIAD